MWELRVLARRLPKGDYDRRTPTFRGTEKQARKALAGFAAETAQTPATQ